MEMVPRSPLLPSSHVHHPINGVVHATTSSLGQPRSPLVPSSHVHHPINGVVHATTSSLGQQMSTFYNSPNSMDELQNNMVINSNNNDSGSINMMEFLENILFSDETTQTQDQSHHNHDHVHGSYAMPVLMQQQTSLQDNSSWAHLTTMQQGSFSLPTSLFRERVDQLQQQQHLQINNHCNLLSPPLPPQETNEEMISLEEYLMKSGALEVINPNGHDHHQPPPIQTLMACNNLNNINHKNDMDKILLMHAAAILEVAPPQIIMNSTTSVAGPTDLSSFEDVLVQGGDDEKGKEVEKRGRKRKGIIEEVPMEVMRERKIQRMIKNRESASKSRSRKLTYTHQLEAELEILRAQNSTLKNQVNLVMKKLEQRDEMKQKDVFGRKLRRSSSHPSLSFM